MNEVNSNMFHYIKHLHTFVESQSKKIDKLEKDMKHLQAEITAIKKEKTIHIDKIEYKFDQLKVETLAGTLNIGITPNGTGSIEEYAVNGTLKEDVTFPQEEKHKALFHTIKGEIDTYLQHGVKEKIHESEEKYQVPLDNTYQQLIIQDVKKQLNQQIQLYINKLDQKVDDHNMDSIKSTIIQYLTNDIHNAIDSFIQQLPKRGE